MKSVRTTLAYAAAIALVAGGLIALLNPLVAVRLLGLEVIEPRGLSEIRAGYGAALLTMGGIMIWAVPMRPRSAPWLRFAGLLWLAATAGRTASVILDGAWTPMNLLFLLVSAVVAFAFLAASFQTRPRSGRGADATDLEAPQRRRFGLGRARSRQNDAQEGDDEPDPLRAYRS